MKVTTTDFEGVYIIEPKVFSDSRGYFFESYSKKLLNDYIGDVEFVQDNESESVKGVVRGLHFQRPPHSQAKLVRCIKGIVRDIAVDIRRGSPTFGKFISIILSEENKRQFFIPHGFAHGFEVLSDTAIFQYKCDRYYQPESEDNLYLFDPILNIDWKTEKNSVILSAKDNVTKDFTDFDSPFVFGCNYFVKKQ